VLIFSLAALGLNILTGYAGQLSLGSAAFMAVGAFAAYNFMLRIPACRSWWPSCSAACARRGRHRMFGLPSLRIKGFYLAVATLAAQFFIVWALTKVGWFSNYSSSGVITAQDVRSSATPSTRRPSTCWCSVVTVTGAAGEEHGAQLASAGPGWRCATWTWRPR
jgi:branched-chain amino acid transport system permease protein